jgi:anthranilate phosphoribosyltransferase
MTSFDSIISILQQGTDLSENQMIDTMRIIMDGGADEPQMTSFLTALADKGETVTEITGAAKVLREKVAPIAAPADALDCCGTGGDASGTYNISTAVAFVAAACGVPMAKHGNRSASSKSGAADVLEALGVNLDMEQAKLEESLQKFNFCFLMAPHHHQAMKHVVPVRKKLGRRTVFNVLGPLANPAGTKKQLIGVFSRDLVRPMAEVLNNLGTEHAWVVHGRDGLDEITVTDSTDVAVLENGSITEKTISATDFGLPASKPEELKGGDATENAAALQDLLDGKLSAYRDIVIANTAAVLCIHDGGDDLKAAATVAAAAIDSGKAKQALENYVAFSNGGAA